ncbi:serine protease inhibitor dipetalogastin-like [Wyeomyia smithii]|uniref:serine protease inhibitor dipetalogastin-like n=1 Tax=Wyeomyia smithii TaxID=174621 RepID=UPI002467EC73|nr:serine protease inhibitor dipetalogastin-like [Wyeomyia smithii]
MTKNGILYISLLVAVVSGSSLKEPCACPRMFLPVCASNGLTYDNECLMHCAEHKQGITLDVVKRAACDGAEPTSDEEQPGCESTNKLEDSIPAQVKTCLFVSGYPELCELAYVHLPSVPNKMLTNKGKSVVYLYDGMNVQQQVTITKRYKSRRISGFRSQYRYSLALSKTDMQQSAVLLLLLSLLVAVISGTEPGEPCVCQKILTPVCASDGITYENECLMHCAEREQGITLDIVKQGSCDETDTNDAA